MRRSPNNKLPRLRKRLPKAIILTLFWDPPLPGPDPSQETRFNSVYREMLRMESAVKQPSPAIKLEEVDNMEWGKIRQRHGYEK